MSLPLAETVTRTSNLIRGMMEFWKDAHGWAPIEAAELLNRSMLEWQTSLADQLHAWCGELTDGQLILAWANIGAMVEGQMKLFLSVHYREYRSDEQAFKKRDRTQDPDGLSLEPLINFFTGRIWARDAKWREWTQMVQQRRNAIHAFKARSIGTTEELHAALEVLLEFVRDINDRLPYPDEVYKPHET